MSKHELDLKEDQKITIDAIVLGKCDCGHETCKAWHVKAAGNFQSTLVNEKNIHE